MKKSVIIVFIVIAVALIAMALLFTKISIKKTNEGITEKITKLSLGSLCSNEEDCAEFCQNNRGQCEEYCKGNKNELCKIIFPSEKSLAQNNPDSIEKSEEIEDCSNLYFTHYLVDPKFVKSFTPIGGVVGGNTELGGRSYVNIKDEFFSEKIPLYSPTYMKIRTMAYYTDPAIPAELIESASKDYAMTFDAGCGVSITLAHVKELVPSLKEISPPLNTQTSAQYEVKQIPVKAGNLIGYYLKKGSYGAGSFDFVMNDRRVINKFANQKRYESGSKAYNYHSVCPYNYYQGEMKTAYYALLPEKDCGTMERDKVGTISGQWFLDPDPTTGVGPVRKEGNYGHPLPIVKGHDRITIGNIGSNNVVWIYPNNPTYKDPMEVISEHCYQNYPMTSDAPQGYVYFKIVDDMTMDVYYSETGSCPSSFPTTGAKRYYR